MNIWSPVSALNIPVLKCGCSLIKGFFQRLKRGTIEKFIEKAKAEIKSNLFNWIEVF